MNPDTVYQGPEPLVLPVPEDCTSVGFWRLDEELHAIPPREPRKIHDPIRGLEGRVFLSILIGHEGRVIHAYVVHSSGHVELDNKALRVAMKWRFTPPRLNGEPVQTRTMAVVTFQAKK